MQTFTHIKQLISNNAFDEGKRLVSRIFYW